MLQYSITQVAIIDSEFHNKGLRPVYLLAKCRKQLCHETFSCKKSFRTFNKQRERDLEMLRCVVPPKTASHFKSQIGFFKNPF